MKLQHAVYSIGGIYGGGMLFATLTCIGVTWFPTEPLVQKMALFALVLFGLGFCFTISLICGVKGGYYPSIIGFIWIVGGQVLLPFVIDATLAQAIVLLGGACIIMPLFIIKFSRVYR